MKKLKCTSCGGDMVIDENKEYATCNYCNTKYKLNEDINLNIKMDEDLKNAISGGISTVKKGSKFLLIPIIIFVIFFMVAFFGIFRTVTSQFKDVSETVKENIEDFDTDSSVDIKEDFGVSTNSFNNTLEMYSGTKSKFFVEHLLDEVVTSNKKNADRLITVVFGEYSTTVPEEIVNLKHSLDDGKYEISLDYDDDGYINKVTMEKIGEN